MAARVNIRKVVSFAVWLVVAVGVMVLLVAAIGYRNNKTCKGYKIDISGAAGESLFIGKREILEMLGHGAEKWNGKAMASFDLRRMEDQLEKNVWIRDAQLFFDNNGILRVNVVEREPIARVFTGEGSGCLIDSSGAQLPLSARLVASLPVFTGYPAAPVTRLHGEDSLLSIQVRHMAEFIRKDSFWMAQIEQVDIRPDRTMEIVPTIGNHLVEFGDGNDFETKFHRLYVFYKDVLSRVGFDKYSRVDVAYAGQVIGTKKGSEGTKQDSIQGLKNIQAMIHAAQHMEPDTARQANTRPLEAPVMNEQGLTGHDLIPDSAGARGGEARAAAAVVKAEGVTAKPAVKVPVKPAAAAVKKPVKKPVTKPSAKPVTKPAAKNENKHTNDNKPKAIMPKRPVKNN